MLYKKVTINSLPKIVFAHRYTTTDYNMTLVPRSNSIEISYIEEGNIIPTFQDGETFVVPEQSVCANTFDKTFTNSCQAPVHSHI